MVSQSDSVIQSQCHYGYQRLQMLEELLAKSVKALLCVVICLPTQRSSDQVTNAFTA